MDQRASVLLTAVRDLCGAARRVDMVRFEDEGRRAIEDNLLPLVRRMLEVALRVFGQALEAFDQAPADDGLDVPRLDPPLRLMRKDDQGNYAGFILPMLSPQGKHGFVGPDPMQSFDLGTYLLNIMGRYLASSGKEFSWDKCQALSDCPWPTAPLK